MTVGRNAPCPCGSGKKYKRCCAAKESRNESRFSKGLVALLGVVLLAVIGIVVAFYATDWSSAAPTRVWSPEHGHWHNTR